MPDLFLLLCSSYPGRLGLLLEAFGLGRIACCLPEELGSGGRSWVWLWSCLGESCRFFGLQHSSLHRAISDIQRLPQGSGQVSMVPRHRGEVPGLPLPPRLLSVRWLHLEQPSLVQPPLPVLWQRPPRPQLPPRLLPPQRPVAASQLQQQCFLQLLAAQPPAAVVEPLAQLAAGP
jgi:hypothetical protein